jgi:DNA repair exonuclease SbcCD ATPase subunit
MTLAELAEIVEVLRRDGVLDGGRVHDLLAEHRDLTTAAEQLAAEGNRQAVRIAELETERDQHRDDFQATADRAVELQVRIGELESRQQELLELVAKLSRETPYADEVKGWTDQRAKMVAEIGTLKAERAAWARDVVLRAGEDRATAVRIKLLEDALRDAIHLLAATDTSNASVLPLVEALGDVKAQLERDA